MYFPQGCGRFTLPFRISEIHDLSGSLYRIDERYGTPACQVPVHLSRIDNEQGPLPPDFRAVGMTNTVQSMSLWHTIMLTTKQLLSQYMSPTTKPVRKILQGGDHEMCYL